MKRILISYIVLISALIGAALLSLSVGSSHFTLRELLDGIAGHNERVLTVLLYIRLPRLFAAVTAGAGLALSGALLQEVLRNPLASPNTVGVNAGAGLFSALCLALFPAAARALPFFSFLGALFALGLVLLLSRFMGGARHSVILGGIACTTFFQSGISFLLVLIPDIFSAYNGFSMGSLFGVSLEDVTIPALLIALCTLTALLFSRRISVLSLGDGVAASLGVRVTPLRIAVLLLASMSAAAAVSFAGLLGFVGLVVPHIARRLMGNSLIHRLLASVLCGGILVTLADLLGRTAFAPSEIPVGILMAAIGVPCFVAILIEKRRANDASR